MERPSQFFNSTDSVKSLISLTNSKEFDIRDFMNYDLIRGFLMQYPTELSLFEVSCILINNRVRESLNDEES